jgi:hypothetical protein
VTALEDGGGRRRGVLAAAALAWADLVRSLAAMPWLVLAMAGYALIWVVPDHVWPDGTSVWTDIAVALVAAVYIVPLCLAIHRFLVLGEASGAAQELGSGRFNRFLAWSLLLYAVGLLIWLPYGIVADQDVAVLLMGLLLIPLLYLILRLIILFPAIAVDDPRASVRYSLDHTRGQVWRIAGIALATWLPVLGPVLGYMIITDRDAPLLVAIATVLCELTAITFASRLYEEVRLRSDGPEAPSHPIGPPGPVAAPSP